MTKRTLYGAKTLREIGAIGVLGKEELKELSNSTQRVFELMKDGVWYNSWEIREAAGKNGVEASEGLRRLRELRRLYIVERRRIRNSGIFQYRLGGCSQKKATQLKLIK